MTSLPGPLGRRARRLALLTAVPLLGLALLAPARPDAVAASAPAPERQAAPRSVEINPRPVGPVIEMGYDLKQPGKAEAFTAEAAADLFGSGRFSILRLPVYATQHPAPGRVRGGAYRAVVAAARRVGDRPVVFASLRLAGNWPKKREPSLPAWAKTDGHVDPRAYGRLLFDYLLFMDGRGIRVDVLGPDNERRFNDADMTPARYIATVQRVRELVARHNRGKPAARRLVAPRFVAVEEFDPDVPFLRELAGRNKNSFAYAGTHYYSKKREQQLGQLRQFATVARRADRPVWDTEFHWNDKPCANGPCDAYSEWETSVRGTLSLIDNYGSGVRGLVWWAYTPDCATAGAPGQRCCRSGPRSRLQRAVAQSSVGSRLLAAPQDGDGTGVGYGGLTTRAFVRGGDVTVWLVNGTTRTLRKPLAVRGFAVPAGYRASVARLSQKGAGATFATSTAAGDPRRDVVPVTVPPRSILVVTLRGAARR